MTKALSVKVKRTEALEKLKQSIFNKAAESINGALRAPELEMDAEGKYIKPDDWSWREFRAAKDALLARKEAPFYLDIAQRNLELEAKLSMMKTEQQKLNVGTINIVAPPKYDVIDITPVKE